MTDERPNDIAEMKSNLLATMSHEMRTPMQSVFGYLELMLFEDPSPKVRAMVEAAMMSASGVLEILDDILDAAKIDADKMVLEHLEIPVRTLVDGVIEALKPKVLGKDVRLVAEVADQVPRVIMGDPKRLRQVLINLAGNAVKFTPHGTVKVKVDIHTLSPYKLTFSIIDTGIGMSEESIRHLFQPFIQADNSTSREFGGTGLGLTISQKLVQMMGGQIVVSSQHGQGSQFRFTIPVEEATEIVSDAGVPDLTGLTVLSLEPHPQAAREIASSLGSMGAKVETVTQVQHGLNLLRRRPFDVIVSEHQFDDGTGLDVIRYTAEHYPHAGLIVYTSSDDPGLKQSLTSLGAKYLEKPAGRLRLGEAVLQMSLRQAIESPSQSGKILVVEDTDAVRELFSKQFELLRADIDFAVNGLDALEKMQTTKYNLILSDLHMPVMDGYGLIHEIRSRETEDGTRLPVVLLTADIQLSSSNAYMPLGFDEALLKPVSLGALRQLLIRWRIPISKTVMVKTERRSELSTSGAISLRILREQMGELNSSMMDMLSHFPRMMRPLLAQIEQYTASGDVIALKEAAHSLKGAARSAGAMELGNIAEHIQKNAEAGICHIELAHALMDEFGRVEVDIRSLTSQIIERESA